MVWISYLGSLKLSKYPVYMGCRFSAEYSMGQAGYKKIEKQWEAKAREDSFFLQSHHCRSYKAHGTPCDLRPFDTCNHLHFYMSNFPVCADPAPWHDTGREYNAPSGAEIHVGNRVSTSDPNLSLLGPKIMKRMPFGAQHHLKWFSWSKTPNTVRFWRRPSEIFS